MQCKQQWLLFKYSLSMLFAFTCRIVLSSCQFCIATVKQWQLPMKDKYKCFFGRNKMCQNIYIKHRKKTSRNKFKLCMTVQSVSQISKFNSVNIIFSKSENKSDKIVKNNPSLIFNERLGFKVTLCFLLECCVGQLYMTLYAWRCF